MFAGVFAFRLVKVKLGRS